MSLLQQRRKSRISLSDIDQLARTGQVQLTANEVQLFQRKGILKSTSLPTPPLTTISETVTRQSTTVQMHSTSATAIFSTSMPTQSSSSNTTSALMSLSETATGHGIRRGSSISSSSSSPSPSARSLPSPRPNEYDDSEVRKRKRANEPGVLPPQKQSVGPFHFNTFENTTSHLFPEMPSTGESSLASWRRHSTANALNTTSPSTTLSVDYTTTRRSSTSVIPSVVNTPLGQRTVLYAAASPAHTLYSLPYKTSSDNLSHDGEAMAPQSSYCPPSPMSPVRKRKSIPHRSPSANEPQDISPGVVFQLPFGHWSPSLTTKAPRETSLSSSYSSSTEIIVRPPSPPNLAPSPNSTSAATIVMQSSTTTQNEPHVTENENSADSSLSNTNASASTTESSTITHATANTITSTASSNTTTTNNSSNSSSSSETLSIEQSSSTSGVEHPGLGIHVDNMPLTPPTTICPEAPPTEGTPAPSSLSLTSAPWTPITPSNGFSASAASQPSDGDSAHLARDASRARDNFSPVAAEDPSQLPLKAQRQLSIRRQSLIPRPELDFVNGSGILPPASQNLDTRGGAHILSYPVLLSDMVQVAMDDAHARGELDGHSEEMESDSNHHHHSKPGMKRKRGGNHGKKRGSISGQGQADGENDEHEHDGDTQTYNQKRRRSSQAIPSGALNGFASNNSVSANKSSKDLMLGSPITLSNSPRVGRQNARSAKLGRPRKPKASYEEDDQTYEPPLSFNPPPSAIPPEEIEVAIRHTREIVMHMEAKASLHGGSSYQPTTLQPLLDATRHLQEQEGYHEYQHQQHNGNHYYQQHQGHMPSNQRYKAAVVDDDETEDEHRPVRSNRGQSHRTYPGESEYDDEDEDDEELSQTEDSGSAREVSPTMKHAGGKNLNGKVTKTNGKRKLKGGEGSEVPLKRKRQNKEAIGAESNPGPAATKKRRPSSTAVSGFSSVAYAQQQKAKIEGRLESKPGAVATSGSSKDGTKESNGRSSKSGEKKTCLACKIQDTPCWRPSYKEGTSLCNSCGLRYKKVGVICLKTDCNYIPIKSEYASMEAERIRLGIDYLTCLRCKNAVFQPASRKGNNSNGASTMSSSSTPGPSSSSLMTTNH
ncbi:DNA-binding transcription repressor [Actinomortierella wolfii]|nr:DNA-binding transcription repressor [Actinomortierella wolfii]